MIFPEKHLSLYESLIGLSSYILITLKEKEMDLDAIWETYRKFNDTKKYPAKHNFDDVVLAIDILFALKKINVNKNGILSLK